MSTTDRVGVASKSPENAEELPVLAKVLHEVVHPGPVMEEVIISPEPVAAGREASSYGRLRELLTSERRFWNFCAVVLGLFAVLKGLRMPSSWAATQAQLDYSHGFIKRGLQGAVLGAIGGHHYSVLSVVFFIQLALFCVAVVLLTRQASLEKRFGSSAILALFASSYAVTYLIHMVGYTDIVLGLFALVLLVVRTTTTRFWLALTLVPVALLIHENFLFIFLPVVLFSFFLDRAMTSGERERRRIAIYIGILATVAVSLTALTSFRANMTASAAEQFKAEVAIRTDFPIRTIFFDTLSRSLVGNISVVVHKMAYAWWWQDFSVATMTILPVMIVLVAYVERLLKVAPGAGESREYRRMVWVTWVVFFAPLMMYGLGWDCVRWDVLCLLSGFLVLLLLSRSLPQGEIRFGMADRNAVVLLVAVNMVSGYGFFDNFNINPYPFYPALEQVLRRVS